MGESLVCIDLLKTHLINREFSKSNISVEHNSNCISDDYFTPLVDVLMEMLHINT